MSYLGINFSDGTYEDWRWPNFHTIIRANAVRWVNICGASQYEQAIQRAIAVMAAHNCRVRFRHMLHQPPGGTRLTDDGMWKLGARDWVNNVALAHRYHEIGVYLLSDNEYSTGGSYRHYAESEAERIALAVPRGVKMAVCSLPTHNPAQGQLEQGDLDPLFQAVAEYMGDASDPKVVLSPNAYFTRDNLDGLRKVVAIRKRFMDVTGREPVIVVGEYGYIGANDAGQLDPHKGYISDALAWADVQRMMIDNLTTYFLPHRIHALAYTVAGNLGGNEVQKFRIDPEKPLVELMRQASTLSEPIPYPIPTEPEDDYVYAHTEEAIENVWLRTGPSTTHSKKSLVTKGERVAVLAADEVDGQLWFYAKRANEDIGWTASWYYVPAGDIVEPPVDPEPPTPEPEPPTPPDDDLEHRRMKAEALQKMRDGLQEVTRGLDKAAQGLQALLLMIETEIEELEEAA